jgi:hypothetical protein
MNSPGNQLYETLVREIMRKEECLPYNAESKARRLLLVFHSRLLETGIPIGWAERRALELLQEGTAGPDTVLQTLIEADDG